MSLTHVLGIAGSALSAQSVRLNTVASNLANAETVSQDADSAYRARVPVFASVLASQTGDANPAGFGVRVAGIVESAAEPVMEYRPEHPLADSSGHVHLPNVNLMEEMADLISASRSYQTNVEVMNTSKQLLLKTLELGS